MKKYYYEGPTFKLCRGSWDPTFKFRGGPGSRIPGTRGPGSWGPGPSFTPCHILCHATNAKGQFFFKILKDYGKR